MAKKGISNLSCRKYNEYFLHETDKNTMCGYTSNTGNIFYFDLEDFDKIKDYCWSEDGGYIKTRESISGKSVYLHVLCFGKKKKKVVDHVDRNKFNNRKSNLRFTSDRYNIINSSIRSTNSSGIIGVSKYRKKWRARIVVNYIEIALGNFTDKKEAIVARLKAEKKYFKEFAPQRHLFEEYNI